MLLVLCMAATMLAGTMVVSADDAAAEETITDVMIFNFDNVAAGSQIMSGKTISASSSYSSTYNKVITTRTFAPTNKSDNTFVVADGDSTDNYLKTDHSRVGINAQVVVDNLISVTGNPVAALSYDICIPAEGDYYNQLRNGVWALGATTAGEKNKPSVNVNTKISHGEVTASVDEITKPVYTDTIKYNYGEWLTFMVFAYINEAGTTDVAVYANDTLVYYGVGSKATAGMAFCSNIDWRYSTKENNSATSSETDTIASYTYYDDLKLQLYPASAKMTEAKLAAAEAAKNDRIAKEEAEKEAAKATQAHAEIINVSFDDLATTSTDKDGKYSYDAETGILTGTASKGGFGVVNTTGELTQTVAQGSNTKADTQYSIVEEGSRKALKVKADGYTYLTQNSRGSIAPYFRSTETQNLVYSFDMKLATGTKNVTRKAGFNIGLDNANTTDSVTKQTYVGVEMQISKGKVSFTTSRSYTGEVVPGAEKSETRDVVEGEWFTPVVVVEISRGEEAYNLEIFGIYGNEVIYTNKYTIAFNDADGDGVSDNLGINTNTFMLGATGASHETYLDNFVVAKNNNFDWSAIDTDAWTVPAEVKFVKDGNDLMVSATSAKGEKFTSGVMVVAIYNANGMLEEFIPVTTITDGDKTNSFNGTVPAAKLATGKIVKAFIVDGIATFKPLIANGKYIVE